MYYRRKILLSLLEAFGGKVEKLKFQKVLFLLSKRQKETQFDFVPYKFGCFSFQANADLNTLKVYEKVGESEVLWIKTDRATYLQELKQEDRIAINAIKQLYGNSSAEELIRLTYTKYPYYSINSTVVDRYLDEEGRRKVEQERPVNSRKALYTIGYEGMSLEAYLNKLLEYDVKVLCDVRKNPKSMKYGFSKKQLQNACEGVGIKYEHFPDLGIASAQRQELHTQNDYDELFLDYSRSILPKTLDYQCEIIKLVEKYDRVSLTCFEADKCQCHRSHLADAISRLPDFDYEIIHL